MTIKLTRITNILLLVLGMFIAPQVLAEIQITDVVPASAAPGVSGLEVQIYGNDFNNKAEVSFHKSDGSPATDITVQSATPNGSTKIIATIDIAPDAAEADYTLQVMQQRRGGKGTTYDTATFEFFKVTGKPQEATDCGGADGVFKNVAQGDCNCKFVKKDQGGQGTPSVWLWVLQGPCWTHATLALPQYEVLNGNDHTLTALPPNNLLVDYSSVITNSGHRTHVFNLKIDVDQSVAAGCGPGLLNSAISFVLDDSDSTEHPRESTDKDGRYYDLTRLRAWGITVDSAVPLCKAIEFRRQSNYDLKLVEAGLDPSVYTDAEAQIYEVIIRPGSYSETGLQVSGFVNAGAGGRSGEHIGILKSTVMGAALEPAPAQALDPSAIRFGPVYGEGTVGQNAISANGTGEFGISVEGGGDSTDDVTIENNDVTGAYTGVQVDGLVDSTYFKSNILVGTGSGDGIDTSAFENRYRSNRIDGFDCEVREDGSCIIP